MFISDSDIQSSSYFNIHTKEKILTPPKYREHPITKRMLANIIINNQYRKSAITHACTCIWLCTCTCVW